MVLFRAMPWLSCWGRRGRRREGGEIAPSSCKAALNKAAASSKLLVSPIPLVVAVDKRPSALCKRLCSSLVRRSGDLLIKRLLIIC